MYVKLLCIEDMHRFMFVFHVSTAVMEDYNRFLFYNSNRDLKTDVLAEPGGVICARRELHLPRVDVHSLTGSLQVISWVACVLLARHFLTLMGKGV